jgi:hypothetical protein
MQLIIPKEHFFLYDVSESSMRVHHHVGGRMNNI